MKSVMAFVKVCRARAKDGLDERWAEEQVAPTVNVFDVSTSRFVTLVAKVSGNCRRAAAQTRARTGGRR